MNSGVRLLKLSLLYPQTDYTGASFERTARYFTIDALKAGVQTSLNNYFDLKNKSSNNFDLYTIPDEVSMHFFYLRDTPNPTSSFTVDKDDYGPFSADRPPKELKNLL